MSTTSPRADAGPEEIQADIESTRAQLAATVDALAAKFDVGAQAKTAVHDVRENVSEAAHGAAERAAGAAGKVKDTISGVAGSAAGRVENVAHAGKVRAREAAGQIADVADQLRENVVPGSNGAADSSAGPAGTVAQAAGWAVPRTRSWTMAPCWWSRSRSTSVASSRWRLACPW